MLTQTEVSPSRAEALARLERFLPHAGRTYARTRNEDRGPDDRTNVSGLSPFIRHRLITEEEVVRRVLSGHRFSDAEKFVQEVYWRTYFKGWLEARPWVWRRYLDAVAAEEASLSVSQRVAVEAAKDGNTGIACFDAWAEELTTTGYLHNHARMWYASIWIFTLRLPWALGAAHFLRHLLDGDSAANTLSWRWVAGLHTQGKHYVARADNIRTFTQGRFDPRGQLDESPAPLHDDWNGTPSPAPEKTILPEAARASLLLLHEDDLGTESLLPHFGNRRAVALVTPADLGHRSVRVSQHIAAALDDTAQRVRAADGPVMRCATPADILAAARAVGADSIVMPYAPVGWAADALDPLTALGEAAGIGVHKCLRDHDARAWPYAQKGFFALKQKLPILLPTNP